VAKKNEEEPKGGGLVYLRLGGAGDVGALGRRGIRRKKEGRHREGGRFFSILAEGKDGVQKCQNASSQVLGKVSLWSDERDSGQQNCKKARGRPCEKGEC